MNRETQKLYKSTLLLPPIERAELVERLMDSFMQAGSQEIKKAWAKEAEDRVQAYERGEVEVLSVHEVFERIQKKEKK